MSQVKTTEWKSGFVFRRVRNIILWLFCCVIGLGGILLFFVERDIGGIVVGIPALLINYGTRNRILEMVKISYLCMPWFNRRLTKSQQEAILSDENFQYIDELRYGLSKHMDIAESEHWIRIQGHYISKELLLCFRVVGHHNRHGRDRTPFEIMYLDGSSFIITLSWDIGHQREVQFHKYFWKQYGTITRLRNTPEREQEIRNDFSSIYHNYIQEMGYTSEYEALQQLVMDSSELKQRYKDKYNYLWEREEKYFNRLHE